MDKGIQMSPPWQCQVRRNHANLGASMNPPKFCHAPQYLNQGLEVRRFLMPQFVRDIDFGTVVPGKRTGCLGLQAIFPLPEVGLNIGHTSFNILSGAERPRQCAIVNFDLLYVSSEIETRGTNQLLLDLKILPYLLLEYRFRIV